MNEKTITGNIFTQLL